MHLCNTTPSTARYQAQARISKRTHQWALAACWAMVAYCRLAGVDFHGLTAGPGVAPVPATRSLLQRQVFQF
jgi:hypothetical protein